MAPNHFIPTLSKLAKFLCYALLILVFVQANGPVSPSPQIFVAASPCDPVMRPMLSIPADMNCEMIKWKLTLLQDPKNPERSRFELAYTYGMTKPGTQGFMNDEVNALIKGKWANLKNTGNLPAQFLIQLNPDDKKTALTFLKLDKNLLHLLDQEGKLMIGNAAFSYTLNKIPND